MRGRLVALATTAALLGPGCTSGSEQEPRPTAAPCTSETSSSQLADIARLIDYPALACYPVASEFGFKTEAQNHVLMLEGADVDPSKLSSALGFIEKLRAQLPAFSYSLRDSDTHEVNELEFRVSPQDATTHLFIIAPGDLPLPSYAPPGQKAHAFTLAPSSNNESQTFSIVPTMPVTETGPFADLKYGAEKSLMVQACQAVAKVEVTNVDPSYEGVKTLNTIGQEVWCNSVGVAIRFAQAGVSHDEYVLSVGGASFEIGDTPLNLLTLGKPAYDLIPS